ncbi:MAG: cob(I)yrinic acid a,c-diamide adenosyltransferase [Ignavibacteria bacterium]|nr:cob(I)yrinic acid a,c-diamide adenosyltransferase [Ignavibacteria bacterium]
MSRLERGFTQIYTGNGKGKTTAAIGQAARAAGYGLKSFIIQFMKEYPYNELNSLELLNEFITIEQYCGDDFVYKKEPAPAEEIEKAKFAINKAIQVMNSGEYDLVILDEACVSVYFGLLTTTDLLNVIKNKPAQVELILTGRYCPDELIAAADLVTEMKEIKHYYTNGILSRKGIES